MFLGSVAWPETLMSQSVSQEPILYIVKQNLNFLRNTVFRLLVYVKTCKVYCIGRDMELI